MKIVFEVRFHRRHGGRTTATLYLCMRREEIGRIINERALWSESADGTSMKTRDDLSCLAYLWLDDKLFGFRDGVMT